MVAVRGKKSAQKKKNKQEDKIAHQTAASPLLNVRYIYKKIAKNCISGSQWSRINQVKV